MKLTVQQGRFGYSPDKPVIQDLNFSAESGELIAILGPNGVGKTTLLRCIMGLLKWQGGTSTIDGIDINAMSAKQLWQQVAYVPQARGAFAALTAQDMILLGTTSRIGLFSTPGPKERQLVYELAEKLGIQNLLAKKCNEISGGELQMVLIARAMAAQPKLLILDEPESNLDFKNQLIVLNAMTDLTTAGICCIFNTHYPNHALLRASSSLLLQSGGQAIFGETSQVVTAANIQAAFGVDAVIGAIETPEKIYPTVMPLRLTAKKTATAPDSAATQPVIATVAIMVSDSTVTTTINNLLSTYETYIIGRLGLPQQVQGVAVINVVLKAPINIINALTHRIEILPQVCTKTTVANPEMLT
ncbi:MAG: ATP-binding cassette domain-containing protein [Lactobacillus sp.]|jgi:iron complex transport system ATP-binding protein|nr:ATP-binding cassette domain-containing protein [Lactobacillus sp.]